MNKLFLLLVAGLFLPLCIAEKLIALPLMGKHFDAKYPTFPYGPTDPYGYSYCVVATNLYYTAQKPYVRIFLPTSEKNTPVRNLKRSSKNLSRPSPNRNKTIPNTTR
ncbi:hypothetical protein A7K93_10005 [Candidatus Methylacidiphilum fumarolicum]|uniref:Uncharacterized protein n=2 Tax=Candidatus Methylacidiphilum fumarolicum TaxID=591154 RepID=I0K080_METFB|nr:hypothetical protein [Candidatus Methylacidiphilum fumarolicum]MBW6414251.1 hypothetical protein [Candidatus Methylacidiphilum fumarolicum]TFE70427.1 hypothetical protein A7K73_03755 [Candidatus Methylacidiphilum fumarolicum]TFE71883.1 hypothetical protein A7K93_10005 [Candidatus Methylacidiphilum fumarolicum]TFE71932.1 hypothetical protein A7K72_09795 [Candidatus Methylacidiphilum fumarolicum]TFE75128.1 hypothetical protein A7D33_11025 [Candidatus Methylacidiphilum fumarolicum]